MGEVPLDPKIPALVIEYQKLASERESLCGAKRKLFEDEKWSFDRLMEQVAHTPEYLPAHENHAKRVHEIEAQFDGKIAQVHARIAEFVANRHGMHLMNWLRFRDQIDPPRRQETKAYVSYVRSVYKTFDDCVQQVNEACAYWIADDIAVLKLGIFDREERMRIRYWHELPRDERLRFMHEMRERAWMRVDFDNP